jgi:hypothetical protein
MEPVIIRNAYFIKLGRKGVWEEDSIKNGILRFGWRQNSLADILAHDWDSIGRELGKTRLDPGALTRDVNQLKEIVLSTRDDVWVTFHDSMLWWCRLTDDPPQEDGISRFRRTEGWRNSDIKGKKLISSQIAGSLSKTQAFRGTNCSIRETDVLERLINAQQSPIREAIERANDGLVHALAPAIQQLHWKDFETLVDLIFRGAGWKRVSIAGETVKDVDMELEEPVTRDRYQVQIKASASRRVFEAACEGFNADYFRRFYFVIHSPEADLANFESPNTNVKLIRAAELAEMTAR